MSEARLLHIVREWIEYTKRVKTIDRRVVLNYAREMEKEMSLLAGPLKRTVNRDIEEALNSGDGTYKP